MTPNSRKLWQPRSGLRLLTILFCCCMLYAGVEVSNTFIDDNGNLVINGTGFGTEEPTVELGGRNNSVRGAIKVLKFSPTQIVVAPPKLFCLFDDWGIFINGGHTPDFIVTLHDFGLACPHIDISAYDSKTKMVTFTGKNLAPPAGAECSLKTDGKTIPAFCTSTKATCILTDDIPPGYHTCHLNTSMPFCTGGDDVCHNDVECAYNNGGVEGPTGPRGLPGPVGPMGPMGMTGVQGIAGAMGPMGAPGATGAQGSKGDQGPMGAQGAMGPIGLTGPQGVAGPAGPMGAQGSQGSAGPAGPMGAAGATGAQGPKGDSGPMGAQGLIGLTGPQGLIGATGSQGAKGDPGAQGPSGSPGPQGPPGAAVTKVNVGFTNTGSSSFALIGDTAQLTLSQTETCPACFPPTYASAWSLASIPINTTPAPFVFTNVGALSGIVYNQAARSFTCASPGPYFISFQVDNIFGSSASPMSGMVSCSVLVNGATAGPSFTTLVFPNSPMPAYIRGGFVFVVGAAPADVSLDCQTNLPAGTVQAQSVANSAAASVSLFKIH